MKVADAKIFFGDDILTNDAMIKRAISFANAHVRLALESANNGIKKNGQETDITFPMAFSEIILKAYPIENIK